MAFGLFKNKETWEEKQSRKLRGLRKTRVKEESRGKIRELVVKEEDRISTAKSKGRGSGGSFGSKLSKGMGSVGKGLETAGRYSQGFESSFNQMDQHAGSMMGGRSQAPARRRKSKKRKGKSRKSRRASPRQDNPFDFNF